MAKFVDSTAVARLWQKIKDYVDTALGLKLDADSYATDTTYGIVKLNSAESVDVNSAGQLTVGGRLGQFPNGGVFYSNDRAPRAVGSNTFLITDALGMNCAASRSFALLTGQGITLNGSHAAGSTTYNVQNTFLNRLACAGVKFLALDEAASKVTQIAEVTSVTIGGAAFTPTSAADSTTPIVIEVATSANPNAAATQLRAFRQMTTSAYCSIAVGNGAGMDAGGSCIVVGQHAYSKTGNMNIVVGQYQYNQGNGNALFGRYHISKKNRWFMAGTGHDNTNGRSEAGAALGQYSLIDASTLLAVGNGTSHTARSNAFEVRPDGIVLLSPNGTRFLVAVDDGGNLSATALT